MLNEREEAFLAKVKQAYSEHALKELDVPGDLFDSEEFNKALIHIAPACIRLIPSEKRTMEVAKELAGTKDKNLPLWLSEIPEDCRTYNICKACIENKTFPEEAVESIPEKYQTAFLEEGLLRLKHFKNREDLTEEHYKAAVKADWWQIQFIPEGKRSVEVCEEALHSAVFKEKTMHTGVSFDNLRKYLPSEVKESKAFKKFESDLIKQNEALLIEDIHHMHVRLYQVKTEFMTENVCVSGVVMHPEDLRYVPNELKTELVYTKAVENDPMLLKTVPKERQTQGICCQAVKGNALAMQFVAENLKTSELCEEMFKGEKNQCNVRELMAMIPDAVKTRELYGKAVEWADEQKRGANDSLLACIPKEMIDYPLAKNAVIKRPADIACVPEENMPEKEFQHLCDIAFERDVSSFSHIPEKYRSEEMCDEAVQKDPELFALVPKEKQTEYSIMQAVKWNSLATLPLIAEDRWTQKLCDRMVEETNILLDRIPEKFRTNELCGKAVEKDARNYRHVTADYVKSIQAETKQNAENIETGRKDKAEEKDNVCARKADAILERNSDVLEKWIDMKQEGDSLQYALFCNIKNKTIETQYMMIEMPFDDLQSDTVVCLDYSKDRNGTENNGEKSRTTLLSEFKEAAKEKIADKIEKYEEKQMLLKLEKKKNKEIRMQNEVKKSADDMAFIR